MQSKIKLLQTLSHSMRNPIRANLDCCLFLSDLKDTGGHIYLNGWAYIRAYTKTEFSDRLRIRVESARQQIASLICDVERLDVQQAQHDAPQMCGFEAYVPFTDRACLT